MAELTLNQQQKEKEVLTVNVGKESFNIPLASTLPLNAVKKIRTKEETLDFLMSFVPEKLLDVLTIADFTQIMQEWTKASKEAGGVTPGESQASQG